MKWRLIGAYDLLQSTFMNVWIGEIASDNTIAGGESVNDTQGLHQIDDMTHGGVNNELRSCMRWMYSGITRCNFIMENKDNIDFNGKDKIIAEAKFLSAFYYFELVKFFGDVPLVIDQKNRCRRSYPNSKSTNGRCLCSNRIRFDVRFPCFG